MAFDPANHGLSEVVYIVAITSADPWNPPQVQFPRQFLTKKTVLIDMKICKREEKLKAVLRLRF